jgi:hypothetical protein
MQLVGMCRDHVIQSTNIILCIRYGITPIQFAELLIIKKPFTLINLAHNLMNLSFRNQVDISMIVLR